VGVDETTGIGDVVPVGVGEISVRRREDMGVGEGLEAVTMICDKASMTTNSTAIRTISFCLLRTGITSI